MFSQDGRIWTNVLHGNLTAAGPLNPAIAESLFSAIKAAGGTTAWFAHLDPALAFTGVEVKDLRAANNPAVLSTGVALNGTGTGRPLGMNTSLTVTLRTQFTGRGFFGRVYLAGMDDSTLATARTFAYAPPATQLPVNFVTAIQTAMNAQSIPMVVAQRYLLANQTPGAPPPYNSDRPDNVIPVTSIVMTDQRIDSQRRRSGR